MDKIAIVTFLFLFIDFYFNIDCNPNQAHI